MNIDINQLVFLIAAGAIPVLFAITLHEVAHGWVAYKLGDSTAKMLGRLTVNPIKHIDPVGTIALPIGMLVVSQITTGQPFAFGWAKPIPVNTRNLAKPRRDMAIVAVAGPMANLLMAIFWIILLGLFSSFITDPNIRDGFVTMAKIGLVFNVILMVLNLLPIPPLDGGRVLAGVTPLSVSSILDRIEPYGFMIVLGLLILGVLDKILAPMVIAVLNVLQSIFL